MAEKRQDAKKQEVATVPQDTRIDRLRGMLMAKGVQAQLKLAMPAFLDPDRAARQVVTLVQTNPELMRCTDISILSGLMRASELGLEITGALGQAYLVPRWSGRNKAMEATFQIGYRGFIDLAFRSDQIGAFNAHVVFTKDEFWYRYGTDQKLHHVPVEGDRGVPSHYYAVVQYKRGGSDFEVMTHADMVEHRLRYSPPPKDREDRSAWATNFPAMACKTMMRALGKRLPLSVELRKAALMDEYHEQGIPTEPPAGLLPDRAPTSRGDQVLAMMEGEVLMPQGHEPGEAGEYQGDPEPGLEGKMV